MSRSPYLPQRVENDQLDVAPLLAEGSLAGLSVGEITQYVNEGVRCWEP